MRIYIDVYCREGVEHPSHVAARKCDAGDARFTCPARHRIDRDAYRRKCEEGAAVLGRVLGDGWKVQGERP